MAVLPSGVALQMLDDVRVSRDGRPVVLTPTSERLLCFLALRRGPVRRLLVSGTLWDGADERRAGACLRSALWRLHSVELVQSSSSHLWLSPAVSVDVHHMVDNSLAVLRGSAPDDTLQALARALVDNGDEVLPGWYEDWVIAERERFRMLRLNALDRLGERLLETGCWYDALQVALAVTRSEPLRESAYRLLVRLNLRQDNIAEAVHQYRRYERLLRVELGVRPSDELRRLIAPFLSSRGP